MLIASAIAAFGLVVVAATTQSLGYRLGGTITIPVLAVYTLKSFVMLPLFLVSTVVAYLGLWGLRRWTLIYGRDELVAAIAIGTVLPLASLVFVFQTGAETRAVVFIGSILPGLAAFNYHRLKPEYRTRDLLSAIALLLCLLGLGWLLVTPQLARTIGTLTPPALFSETADIARYKRAVVPGTEPIILPRAITAVLFVGGIVVVESLRDRYGVRIGVIAPVLLAVYALSNYWFIALYVVLFFGAYALVEAVNYVTLRYGRVVLGLGVAFATVVAVPLTMMLPIGRGLSAFFVAILAGVTAYNAHATAPIERRLVLPLQLLVFVPVLFLGRAFGTPAPRSLLPRITVLSVLVGATVVVVAFVAARFYIVSQPDRERVLSASILSDGEGS